MRLYNENGDRLEYEYEQAYAKMAKRVQFKGGGGGGTNTVQKADPWEEQKPFLEDIFQQAQSRFNEDGPNFFPGETIAGFNPNETAYQQFVTDYATGGQPQQLQAGAQGAVNNLFGSNAILDSTRGLAPYGEESLVASGNFTDQAVGDQTGASPLMQQMLSGSVQQNPFIDNAIQGYTGKAIENFQQNVMPALRASQTAYQHGGSSRGDIASGVAAGNVANDINQFSGQMYSDAFNSAQAQQMGAAQMLEQGRGARANEALQQGSTAFGLGLAGEQARTGNYGQALGAYGDVSQTPIDIAGNINDIGGIQRQLAQQYLDEDVNRFQFDQNIQDQKLQNYANLVQGNYGSTNTTSQSRGGTGLAGLGQAVGGLGALAGAIG